MDISTTSKLQTSSPIHYIDPYLSSIYFTFSLIGIPINLLVAGTIILKRKLQTTQNIAWLGCGFANIFVLSGFLVEVAAAGEENSFFFLPLYQGIAGLPDACLVLYLHLYELNRRVFFAYPSFYKKYVNNAWILTIQITCFVLVALAIKGPIFFQSVIQSLKLIFNEMDPAQLTSISDLCVGGVILYLICYKKLQVTEIDSIPIDSTNSLDSNDEVEASFEQFDDYSEIYDEDDDILLNLENHQELGLLELQDRYSTEINKKAFYLFITSPLLSLSCATSCRLFSIINNEELFESCSSLFATTFYLYGMCIGFYTAVFNPLCFCTHISYGFACNPIE